MLFFLFFIFFGDSPILFDEKVSQLYHNISTNSNDTPPKLEVFKKAYQGYDILNKKNLIKKEVLTIIDYSLSANEKRMWIIDLTAEKILYHNLVAHGKKTGNEYAKVFSNNPQSNMSSLGFFITESTYHGKHGLSLYLKGMEKGINDNAKKRSIVMHGAEYVSKSFIKQYGRLGRSLGCPAVPTALHKDIITTIKDNSCIFIYYPDKAYRMNSKL